MFMTTHMAAMAAFQLGSDCLHHLKSLRRCWENPKICQTALAAATDCTPKYQSIRGAYGSYFRMNLFEEGQQLPEARDTKEGEVGSLQCHPKDPGGGMEKGKLRGHSWRFTLTRRCFMWEEAPLGSPSRKAHAGVQMPLKSNSRAELRKWE